MCTGVNVCIVIGTSNFFETKHMNEMGRGGP